MPEYFRIDEFKRTASGVISVRDRIRFNSFGFDEWFITPPPPPPPVPGASQRLRYTIDPFGSIPTEARNISLKIQWSSSTAQVTLYSLGISYIPRVDETRGRPTDWDSGNTLTDKFLKGVIIEADTLGQDRFIEVQVDGTTVQTITVPATTKGVRKITQFSFFEVKGRYFRLIPSRRGSQSDNRWQLYQYQWIFDEEPLALKIWETQELDHGVPAWKSPLFGNITLRSLSTVQLAMFFYNAVGGVMLKEYQIPSTSGLKTKTYIQFEAAKGVLIKYLLTSSQEFTLYREETDIAIMPWAGEQFGIVKPFGNDDLDLTRGMYTASGVAERSGGGAAPRRGL